MRSFFIFSKSKFYSHNCGFFNLGNFFYRKRIICIFQPIIFMKRKPQIFFNCRLKIRTQINRYSFHIIRRLNEILKNDCYRMTFRLNVLKVLLVIQLIKNKQNSNKFFFACYSISFATLVFKGGNTEIC